MSESQKQQWLAERASEWDSQMERLQGVYSRHPEDVRGLLLNWHKIEHLLGMGTHTDLQLSVLTAEYDVPSRDLLDVFHWVSWFVGHEIHDDGDPHLVFVQKSLKRGRPYLVRRVGYGKIPGAEPVFESGEESLLIRTASEYWDRWIDLQQRHAKIIGREWDPPKSHLSLQESLLDILQDLEGS